MIKNVFKYMDLVSSSPEELECCCQNRLLRVRLAKPCFSGKYWCGSWVLIRIDERRQDVMHMWVSVSFYGVFWWPRASKESNGSFGDEHAESWIWACTDHFLPEIRVSWIVKKPTTRILKTNKIFESFSCEFGWLLTEWHRTSRSSLSWRDFCSSQLRRS